MAEPIDAAGLLERIHAAAPNRKLRIMNVCGGHERSVTQVGLRSVLPDTIQLVPGPGCPVCICPEEDILQAIRWSLEEDILLASFGDMLRVPVNLPRSRIRSLEAARAAGGQVVPIASPTEAVELARARPNRPVVFFAVGFETTAAPVAAMLRQGVPDNLYLLVSARRTWPIVEMLLRSGDSRIDALIAPGHVCTVTGPEEWAAAPGEFGVPTAVAGFDALSLLRAILSVLQQVRADEPRLEICYEAAVEPGGNAFARQCLGEVFEIRDAPWRGLPTVPASGYGLTGRYVARDARQRFPLLPDDPRRHAGDMPPGCDCAEVVLGRLAPDECRIYGKGCTPRNPVGPCMVSDEGACRIWWAAGLRRSA